MVQTFFISGNTQNKRTGSFRCSLSCAPLLKSQKRNSISGKIQKHDNLWVETVNYYDFGREIIDRQAEHVMQQMKILPKMHAWSANNEFLPKLQPTL